MHLDTQIYSASLSLYPHVIMHIQSWLCLIIFLSFPGLGQNCSWFSLKVRCTSYNSDYCTTAYANLKWYDHFMHLRCQNSCQFCFPFLKSREFIDFNRNFCLKYAGQEDPRCPFTGLEDPVSRACKGYEAALCLDNFKVWICYIWSK